MSNIYINPIDLIRQKGIFYSNTKFYIKYSVNIKFDTINSNSMHQILYKKLYFFHHNYYIIISSFIYIILFHETNFF